MPQVPLNTEVIYRRQANRTRLHSVTGWPQKRVSFRTRGTGESIGESFPPYDIRVDLPPQVQSARLVPGGQFLPIQREGDQVWVVVPRIETWETLLLTGLDKSDMANFSTDYP